MALIIAATCVLSNVLVWFGDAGRALFPAMDFAIGIGLLMVWGRIRLGWMLAMSGLFLVEGLLHIAYASWPAHDFVVRYRYDLALNIVYLAQLGLVLVQTIPARIAVNMRSEKT